MPISDWQFWIVTLAALWGAWQILRQLLPSGRHDDGAPHCGGCASGAAACSPTKPGGEPPLVTIGRGRPRRALD